MMCLLRSPNVSQHIAYSITALTTERSVDPMLTDKLAGVLGGAIAARVLSGEKPENIPISQNFVAHPTVDWRQLRRWNMSESALPPGTIVLYRQPTVWKRYEKYIVAGIVLIILQALLILGLLWQRARKRKTEATLRESEKRFRVMANTTPSLVWMSDKDGNVIYLNDRRVEFTGRDPKAGFEDTWTAFIHPDDLESVQTANTRALEQRERFSKEYRLRRRDGVYRWMLDVAAPRIDGDGGFAGFIGSAIDVTDQKLAQEALEKVSGKLIEAQETERSRIARELHDDICQRLAMLTLELEQASRGANGSSQPAQENHGTLQRDRTRPPVAVPRTALLQARVSRHRFRPAHFLRGNIGTAIR